MWGIIIGCGVILTSLMLVYLRIRNNNFYQQLFELEEAFEKELDFVHLSKNILCQIMKETKANAGTIYWFDDVQNEFKLKTIQGIPANQINFVARNFREPKGILQYIQAEPLAFLIPDLKVNCDFNKAINLNELKNFFKSLLVVPLNNGSKTAGILTLFKNKNSFSKEHLNLLNLFAPRATVRLENARLYQLTRETALENARLYVNISKLYQQATLDELTGLFNRNFLMQRLKEEIKKAWRFSQPLSILFIDLDFFKKVNDEFGHPMGDQLLNEIGAFFKKLIRDYDVACRFGGEEFVVLLPQTTPEHAYDLAERLRKDLSEQVFCSSIKEIRITASFGVSSILNFPETIQQLNDESLNLYVDNLLATADDALYQAKKFGRNKVISNLNFEKP